MLEISIWTKAVTEKVKKSSNLTLFYHRNTCTGKVNEKLDVKTAYNYYYYYNNYGHN